MQKTIVAVISILFAIIGIVLIVTSLIPTLNLIRLIFGLAFVLAGVAAYISGNAYLK